MYGQPNVASRILEHFLVIYKNTLKVQHHFKTKTNPFETILIYLNIVEWVQTLSHRFSFINPVNLNSIHVKTCTRACTMITIQVYSLYVTPTSHLKSLLFLLSAHIHILLFFNIYRVSVHLPHTHVFIIGSKAKQNKKYEKQKKVVKFVIHGMYFTFNSTWLHLNHVKQMY